MKNITSLASVAALLAITAFRQDATQKLAPAARPAAANGARQAASAADVVTAANNFLATLTADQQTTAVVTYSSTNAIKWSNLPCGLTCREGLQLGNLTTAQQTAALAVVQAATGTVAGDGYDEVQQIRAADDNLSAAGSTGGGTGGGPGGGGGGGGYGAGIYFIAFVGTPSATGLWQLQFGGHHLATNITFNGGSVTGATPKFEGVEPLTFTTANANVLPTGTACAPMANEAASMIAMLDGLTTAQQASAKLSQTFSDVVLGPGSDGKFPATRVGIKCSTLSSDQQALVLAAMKPWVQDADDATAAALLATYQGQLADTYISYAGTGKFTTNTDYARIDGPNVWIEFVAQTGVVYNTQTHYHSIWRDRARDYGGNFYTTVLATKAVAASAVFGLYPNPIANGGSLQVQLLSPAASARYTVRDLLGRILATDTFSGSSTSVATNSLTPGTYLLSVETPTQAAVTSRFQVR